MQSGAKVGEYPTGNHGERELRLLGQNAAGHPCAFHGNDDEIIFSSWQQSGSPPRSTTAQLHGGYPTLFTVSDDGKLAVCLVEHWLESDKITWFEPSSLNCSYAMFFNLRKPAPCGSVPIPLFKKEKKS